MVAVEGRGAEEDFIYPWEQWPAGRLDARDLPHGRRLGKGTFDGTHSSERRYWHPEAKSFDKYEAFWACLMYFGNWVISRW
jgi:hypothetical protein